MNRLTESFTALIGFILLLLSTFVYNYVQDSLALSEIVSISGIYVLVFIVLLTVQTWFKTKPYELFKVQKLEYENLYTKIKSTVDSLVQKQRFIDQQILSMIEEEADDIWVITTRLGNEVHDEKIQAAVKHNLEGGKRYTYFLPHPDVLHFRSVEKNLEQFKRLAFYKEFHEQIEIIRLPIETQFLLEEVVIYNPTQEVKNNSETEGINGFTYYENRDNDSEPLHMKIEGELLKFLSDRLFDYVTNWGLRFSAERVLTDYSQILQDEDKLYLVSLLNSKKIMDVHRYQSFISNLETNASFVDKVSTIDKLLSKYKVVP